MPNTGQPSGACIRCKERRVRCDEVKPACLKCFKLGTPCPGYPDRGAITFKDDTYKTKHRAEDMYRKLRTQADQQERAEGAAAGNSPGSSLIAPASSHSRPSSNTSQNPSPPTDSASRQSPSAPEVVGYIEVLSGHLNQKGFAANVDHINDAIQMYPRTSGALKSSIEVFAYCAHLVNRTATEEDMQFVISRHYNLIGEISSTVGQLRTGSQDHATILLAIELWLFIEFYLASRYSSTVGVENVHQMHVNGMSSIVTEAGLALFESQLGRKLYVHVLMRHLQLYSARVDLLPPIPGPENAIDILEQYDPASLAEYDMLRLLRQSYDFRRKALQLLMFNEDGLSSQEAIAISAMAKRLRKEFDISWAKLPAARKFGGSSMCTMAVNAHWDHRILIEDVQVRCLQALQVLEGPSPTYANDIEHCKHRAFLAVRAICQRLPYTFTEADQPFTEEEPPTFQDVLFTWHGHNPLLVCSMVDILSDQQHVEIAHAQAAYARAIGIKRPIAAVPKILLNISD